MKDLQALLIDAGTGNLHSVYNALRSQGFSIHLTSNPQLVSRGGRIILPGVGAFSGFMEGLRQRQLVEPLQRAARRGDPLLGICVGMQALFELSEEMGKHGGLNLLAGRVVRFPNFSETSHNYQFNLKIPQTGWNQIWFRRPSPLFQGLSDGCYAYFNHSYYCNAQDSAVVIATTDYGLDYPSAVQDGNLYGVQFHPEKSQRVGLKILANFMAI